jgi:hypothetical protein
VQPQDLDSAFTTLWMTVCSGQLRALLKPTLLPIDAPGSGSLGGKHCTEEERGMNTNTIPVKKVTRNKGIRQPRCTSTSFVGSAARISASCASKYTKMLIHNAVKNTRTMVGDSIYKRRASCKTMGHTHVTKPKKQAEQGATQTCWQQTKKHKKGFWCCKALK